MARSSSHLRGQPSAAACLSGTCLFAACLFALGCGARSTLEGAETNGQGGDTGTVTGTETTTTTTTITTTTITTTTTTTVNLTGCADGQREGFTDLKVYPYIAGCSGGFQVPGVLGELSKGPVCNWGAGDDGANPTGVGCNAWDLCAPGWHVCGGAAEVAADSPTGCEGVAPAQDPLFFVVRQSGTGCGSCATGSVDPPECSTCSCVGGCIQTEKTSNDVFGCGTIGEAPSDCGVLNAFSDNVCFALGYPWSCGDDGCGEAHNVMKEAPEKGGVLCCLDMLD